MESIVGKRFGRLVVLSTNMVGKSRRADVQCDCGTRKSVQVAHLKCGNTTSCGCYMLEAAAVRPVKHGHASLAGPSGKVPRLYVIWVNMRGRCRNPNHKFYSDYGGRGISVCNEWNEYPAFREFALANGYRDDLQIDRIDNDGNYCPENCRFVTARENMNNRRNTRLITFNGRTLSLADSSREYGIDRWTIERRLRLGWSVEQALTKPVRGKRKSSRTAEPAGAVACG